MPNASYRTRAEALAQLGLPSSATNEQARVAYKKLSKKYHPDNNSSPGAALLYGRIASAYKFIKGQAEPVPVGGGAGLGSRGANMKPLSEVQKRRLEEEKRDLRDLKKKADYMQRQEELKRELEEQKKESEFRRVREAIDVAVVAGIIKDAIEQDKKNKEHKDRLYEAFDTYYERVFNEDGDK